MPVVAGLAAADLLLLALMGVLLLYATRQLWVPFLIWMLSQIPVIGGWVASQAARLINDAFTWLQARVVHLVAPLTEAIRRVISRFREFTLSTKDALNSAATALAHLVYQLLPAVEARLVAFAQAVGAQAQAYAHALTAGAQQLAAAWVQLAQAYALNLYHLALAELAQVNVQLSHWVDQQVRALYAWVTATATSILNKNAADLRQAEARAQAEAAAAAAYAAQLAGNVAQYARTLTLDGEAYARTLTLDAERLASLANAQTLAQALAAAGAVAIEVEAIRALECIKMCNPLGQLGNDLQALDLGIVLAVLIEAATHPHEGAAAVRGLLGPGAALAHQELGALLGRP